MEGPFVADDKEGTNKQIQILVFLDIRCLFLIKWLPESQIVNQSNSQKLYISAPCFNCIDKHTICLPVNNAL